MNERSTAPRVEIIGDGVRIGLPAVGLAGSWGYWIVCIALLAVPQAVLFALERLPIRQAGVLFFAHGACWTLRAIGFYGIVRPLLAHFMCDARVVATPDRLTIDRLGWLFISGTRLTWARDELRSAFADAGGLWIVPKSGLPRGMFFERSREQVDLVAQLIRAALDLSGDWPCWPDAIPVWFVLDDHDADFDEAQALAGQLRFKEGSLLLSHVWHRVCVTFEMRLRPEAAGKARIPWFAGGARGLRRDSSSWHDLPELDGELRRAWRTVCHVEEPSRLTIWTPNSGALESLVESFWEGAASPATVPSDRAA